MRQAVSSTANGGCASASHVFCSTWPTGAAPSGGRRVSRSSSSSRPGPPTLSPSLPPSVPSPALPPLTSSATSSVGGFQRQLPALARSLKFPFHRFTFNLHCSPPSPPPPPVYAFRHLRLPPINRPLPILYRPYYRSHPSTSADSAGVQSLMIG